MNYFSNVFGLITKTDQGTENGGLFLAQYMVHSYDPAAKDTFVTKMFLARGSNGLYRRSQLHTERSVSHDEITGMMVSSFLLNSNHRFTVWKQLIRNLGAYPAVVMDFSDRLPFNLANYYSWGLFVNSPLSYLFLPFFFINMLITMNKGKQETSSKIMYWLKLEAMPLTWINRIMKHLFTNKMVSQYGVDYVYQMRKIYFNQEDENEFPLFTILKR